MAVRYLVIRVPTTGPSALISAPNDFASREEAQMRIDSIEHGHLKQHHTFLDIMVCDEADKYGVLKARGIAY